MTVSIDSQENKFILKDINEIINHRKGTRYFESIGGYLENNSIHIPFSNEQSPSEHGDQDEQYTAILRILEKIGITTDNLSYSNSAEEKIKIIKDENESFRIHSEKARNIRNANFEGSEFEDFSKIINACLVRNLYDQQRVSAYHLAFSQNSCNFSVPGAGKTSIVYAAYSYLNQLDKNDPKYVEKLLIISPLAAFRPWEDEYEECFGKKANSFRLAGLPLSTRDKILYSDSNYELLLTSYQSASNDNDIKSLTSYLKRNKVMLVLDEAHKVKRVDGKWSNAVLAISKYASSRVILTGTPCPYGYQDLYNLYKFIWPTKKIINISIPALITLSESSAGPKMSKVANLIDSISPYFIRIKKSHLGLPEAINNKPSIIKMDDNQQEIYDYLAEKYIEDIENDSGNFQSDDISTRLKRGKQIRLRQAATNPYILKFAIDKYLQEFGAPSDSSINDEKILDLIESCHPDKYTPPKYKAALNIIKEIIKNPGSKGKVIIWTIFIKNIELLKIYLKNNGISSEVIFGETPTQKEDDPKELQTREKIIAKFHSDDCPYKVLIANPFSVGESISLHKACHNAIYLEKDFNASLYMQSKDRIHRYGLKKDDQIEYYYLNSLDSVDETIHRKVLEREERMMDTIESQDIPLLGLELNNYNENSDILAILEDYHARSK